MYGWAMEMWNVKNDGMDKKIPTDQYPVVQKVKMVVRNERGQFHGATNFRPRLSREEKKSQNKNEGSGVRVSRRATGLRLVK